MTARVLKTSFAPEIKRLSIESRHANIIRPHQSRGDHQFSLRWSQHVVCSQQKSSRSAGGGGLNRKKGSGGQQNYWKDCMCDGSGGRWSLRDGEKLISTRRWTSNWFRPSLKMFLHSVHLRGRQTGTMKNHWNNERISRYCIFCEKILCNWDLFNSFIFLVYSLYHMCMYCFTSVPYKTIQKFKEILTFETNVIIKTKNLRGLHLSIFVHWLFSTSFYFIMNNDMFFVFVLFCTYKQAVILNK